MQCKKARNSSGFYVLEFVSVLVIFFPIFLGIIDLYHLFRTRSAVWEAAHKMSEIYKRVGQNPNIPNVPLSRYDGTLYNGYYEIIAALPNAIVNCPVPTEKFCLNLVVTPTASDVSVSVQYQLPTMIIGYLFGGNVVPLSATSTRRLEESFLSQTSPWVEHL